MIKLLNILKETQILVPRRSPEERQKKYLIATQKKIQQYIKDGSKGDLDLNNTPIQSLPDGLTVDGYLNLSNTPIQSLPNGLTVKGSLYLSRCKNLKLLPNDLKVGSFLYLYNTPLSKKYTTKEQLRADYPNIKVEGNIYLK